MELYYTLITGFLFILAISLLIVGVSNDAVNFLNSAIGAKAAPFKVILAIAGAGVLAGADLFQRHDGSRAERASLIPEFFPFSEIMVIFLAVMLTDILLLDFFNTLGLPTSTTISVVFGILGAAMLVSVYNITRDHTTIHNIGAYINIENSGLIIVGIFLSVVIAFSAGLVIQWIVRLFFSFNVARSYQYWSAVWGGFAITAILYFLVIKGAGGSSLVSEGMLKMLQANTGRILLIQFRWLDHPVPDPEPIFPGEHPEDHCPCRHLRPGHGLCQQRPGEFHRGAAGRFCLLQSLCGFRRRPTRSFPHAGSAPAGEYADLLPGRRRHHHGADTPVL